jgi:hypothetical protein
MAGATLGGRPGEIARRPVDDLAGLRLAEVQTCLDEVVAFGAEIIQG